MIKKDNNLKKDKDIVFQSKIEKVFIELQNYSFSHAATDTQNSKFLGRKDLLARLKSIITNSSTRTGVYLITGNRGVGKSSLVEEVARKTSLRGNTFGIFQYLLLLTILVIFMQLVSNEFDFYDSLGSNWWIIFICFIIMGISFFIFGHNSIFRKKINRKKINRSGMRTFLAGCKELSFFKYSKMSPQYDTTIAKLLFILATIELFSLISNYTCLQLFIIYLLWVSINAYYRYCYGKLETKMQEIAKKQKQRKEKECLFDIQFLKDKIDISVLNIIILCCIVWLIALGSFIGDSVLIWMPVIFLICLLIYPPITHSLRLYCSLKGRNTNIEPQKKASSFAGELLGESTLKSIYYNTRYYLSNHNRVFLKINLGHEVLKERDVLRLISRTLETSFVNYYKSLKHTFIWKSIIVLFVLSLSFFTYKVVYEPIFKVNMKTVYLPKVKNAIDYEKRIHLKEINKSVRYIYNYILDFPKYLLTHSQTKKKEEECNYGKFSSIKECYKTKLRAVDYSAIFVLLFTWGMCFILYRIASKFINTPYRIKKRLMKLNEAITSEITNEKMLGGSLSQPNTLLGSIGINLGLAKSKKTMIADDREIEKELTDILEEIQQLSFFMRPPNFIIVFDELDKVEPERTGTDSSTKTKSSMFSLETIRERQSTILKLLINLKFFLTNAKAKFIFIAGREMYDIYLADTSDRNNFIGSIFHDVINVPSFLSDSPEYDFNDPTSLTEEFLCRILIPQSYPVLNHNLRAYKTYLVSEICREQDNEETKLRINKIIAILQQFIIYLAYISKGAPKKLVQQLETFIEVYDKRELDNRFCIKNYRNSRYFLSFDYQDQYAIGMMAYIVNPVFLKFATNNIQKHSDKLLVSSLFMLEYIYKFHNHSFSWKDITVAPEMLEVNKAPELRSIISDLLNFLSQFHIEQSTSGFNDFKFDNLISHEILFLSKIYEEFSAMYNFSLDESLAVKEYYVKLLETEIEKYKNVEIQHSEFVHATSSLHVRLGDLYFYDDELEKANVYYKNGIQALRCKKPKDMSLDQLHLLVKNMMKLGLVYEKRKLYDFAFLTYGELTKLLTESREIDIHEIGLSARLDPNTGKLHFIKSSDDLYTTDCKEEELKYQNYIEVPKLITVADSMKCEDVAAKVQPLSFDNLSYKTQALLFKNSTFEGIKMLYLPLLAKFQILEKSHFGGIKLQDLENLIKEFRFMKRMIDHNQRNLLIADFYAKVGEILYYKNKSFKKNLKNTSTGKEEQIIYSACFFYKKAMMYLLDFFELKESCSKRKGQQVNVNELDHIVSQTPIEYILRRIVKKATKETDRTICNLYARILSDWGNLFLSCDKQDEKACSDCTGNSCPRGSKDDIDDAFFENWSKFTLGEGDKRYKILIEYLGEYTTLIEKANKEQTELCLKNRISKFKVILIMYSLSSNFYKRSDLHKRSALQINKILLAIKSYLHADLAPSKMIVGFLGNNDCLLQLMEKATRSLYLAYDYVNIREIKEREKDLNSVDISLRFLLLDSKIDRMKITYQEIKLFLVKGDDKERNVFLKQYYDCDSDSPRKIVTSPYEINYSVSARIYKLRFKTQLNYYIFSSCFGIDFKENGKMEKLIHLIEIIKLSDANHSNVNVLSTVKGELVTIKEELAFVLGLDATKISIRKVFEKILADSLFCFNEMIKLSKTSGESYFFNHSFFGSTYTKFAEWTRIYELYKEFSFSSNTKIDSYLNDWIGGDFKEIFSSIQGFELAIAHYHKAKETHNGGRAYRNLIDNLFYMKDDYNDRVPHFDIALERFTISTQKRMKLGRPKGRIYDPETYF